MNAAIKAELNAIPADEQIAKLKAEVAALRAMIFTNGDRNMTMEDRTFTVMEDGFIADNNYDFDAGLRLTGDFVDDEKRQYAEMIADALNRHNARLCDCLQCLRGMEEIVHGLPAELCTLIVCDTCGNKRCPHATDHRNHCTGRNYVGQNGSAYA